MSERISDRIIDLWSPIFSSDIFAEDFIDTLIRYGLYFGAAMQIIALLACFSNIEEPSERYQCDMTCTDSDDYSSEQSSPGHRPLMFRARRHDKKKRR